MSYPSPRRKQPLALLFLLAALLILSTPRALAQSDPDPKPNDSSQPAQTTQPAPFTDEITVTATRTPRQVLDAPGTVTVIGAEEIEQRMAIDRADLVRYEPGVTIGNDPTRLGQNGFNIRGIGGNRVLTQIDGIRTAEQFDFGPLGIPQIGLDVDTLDSVEIIRSAGSSLYGSDALGGVITLLTKDPSDYLGGGDRFFGQARLGYDSRTTERSESGVAAFQSGRWQTSIFAVRRDAEEMRNAGNVQATNASRTAPNPIDRATTSALAKLVFNASESNAFELGVELFDTNQDTNVFSGQGVQNLSSTMPPGATYLIDTQLFTATDQQRRRRVSLEQNVVQPAGLLFHSLLWRVYGERSRTEQDTNERRVTTMGGGPLGPIRTTEVLRDATFDFDQDRIGGEVQFHRAVGMHLVTFGGSFVRNEFDMLRGRVDRNPATGAIIPSSTPYPTKYFPASNVSEAGAYVQDEIVLRNGRLRIIPGLRYDRYSLDPDANDPVFLAGNPGTPAPEETTAGALSPKLAIIQKFGENVAGFVQYARGFRSPPYSDVNNGYTNLAFGYTTLPNPDLNPETSNNFELGLRFATARAAGSAVVFENRFRDFIETVTIGTTPAGLIEFQPRNVTSVKTRGIELSGEWHAGNAWTLRGAAAMIRGDNESADVPLNSVPPDQLNLGLRYAPGARWGGELALTFAAAKDRDEIDTSIVNQFATPSYEVVDFTTYFDVTSNLRLQLGVFNVLDEKYWHWSNVSGVSATSPVLDRYTSPGRTASVSLRARL
jgi:hemoglobin/transferrin/lactoferrin receptor protein